jgi:hypothetical protein
MLRPFLAALAACLAFAVAARAAERPADLVLTGTLTGKDHQTYHEAPFKVPAGTARLTVAFDYTGRDQRSVIDLGLRDPQRFRGWSGGNKARVTIEESWATPSYLPGPLPSGGWKLVLGAPNIRKTGQAAYTARIWFEPATAAFAGFVPAPVKSGLGWYRGDLHMHTAHSDGSCLSRRGVKAPCPVFKTLEAAAARGLDFIAVSDHNDVAQDEALGELAPYFDDLLLIPAREVTTFYGHANLFGPTGPIDFQIGTARVPNFGKLMDQVEAAHGLLSINHPGLPSGEACMGCGWTMKDVDYGRITGVEVVNGGGLILPGAPEGPLSGLPFWEARLNAGFRITAVGGSDNHEATLAPDKPSAVGLPTTVVHATELSQTAVLEAIRRGHAFVDVWGSHDRLLEVTAMAGSQRAEMGDILAVGAGTRVSLSVHVAGAPAGAALSLAGDGAGLARLGDPKIPPGEGRLGFDLTADGAAHWLRVDVRSAEGRLLIIGNPIYLRPAP